MDISLILVAILGIFSGGLINVLADDLPARQHIRPPHYPDGAPRPPIAWLGLTAFLFGKRTSPEGVKLTWRHPLTEIVTALLMIAAVLSVQGDGQMPPPLQMVFWLAYMAIFMLITVIDLEHRLILFVVIIPACILALVDAVIAGYGATLSEALLGAALGFVVFFLLYVGGYAFTYIMGKVQGQPINEVAFGYGDVMLITLSGLILGWRPLIFAMFITVFLGALGAVIYLVSRRLIRKRYSVFTPLPYGQYIIVGTILMLLYATEITALLIRTPR